MTGRRATKTEGRARTGLASRFFGTACCTGGSTPAAICCSWGGQTKSGWARCRLRPTRCTGVPSGRSKGCSAARWRTTSCRLCFGGRVRSCGLTMSRTSFIFRARRLCGSRCSPVFRTTSSTARPSQCSRLGWCWTSYRRGWTRCRRGRTR